uniref:Zinc finger PHD-type domain-containing protein n=1 Tax=Amphimedon queenslandica TaxID=400682 RepID=A0A1X7TTV3_AMPQE
KTGASNITTAGTIKTSVKTGVSSEKVKSENIKGVVIFCTVFDHYFEIIVYCICQDIHVECKYMVECDNERCPIKWVHYKCVGLTDAPLGSWYCSFCMD